MINVDDEENFCTDGATKLSADLVEELILKALDVAWMDDVFERVVATHLQRAVEMMKRDPIIEIDQREMIAAHEKVIEFYSCPSQEQGVET